MDKKNSKFYLNNNIIKIIFAIVIVVLCSGIASAVDPVDYAGYTTHSVVGWSNWSTDQTDYTMMFKIWNTSGSNFKENIFVGSGVQTDYDDIRFTTMGDVDLDYWIENVTEENAVMWVEIPYIFKNETPYEFKVYYGNTTVGNTSNADNVFYLYDNFTSLDTTRWNITPTGNGAISVQNGKLVTNYTGSQNNDWFVSGRYPKILHLVSVPDGDYEFSITMENDYVSGSTNNLIAVYNNDSINGHVEFGRFNITYSYSGSSQYNYKYYHTELAGTSEPCTYAYETLAPARLSIKNFNSINSFWLYGTHSQLKIGREYSESAVTFKNFSIGGKEWAANNTNMSWDNFFIKKVVIPEPRYKSETQDLMSYSLVHNISGSQYWIGNQTNYQVKLYLFNISGISRGNAISLYPSPNLNWSDIRFVNGDNITELDYWIESTNATTATVWVEMPSIYKSDITPLRIFWGNASIARNMSNGSRTFMAFDHFDGSSLNNNLWLQSGSAVTISNSKVNITTTGTAASIKTLFSYPTNASYMYYGCLPKFTTINGLYIVGLTHTSGRFTTGWQTASQLNINQVAGGTYVNSALGTMFNGSSSHLYKVTRVGTTTIYYDIDAQRVGNLSTQVTGVNGSVTIIGETATGSVLELDWMAVQNYNIYEPIHGDNYGYIQPVSNFTVMSSNKGVISGTRYPNFSFIDMSYSGGIIAWNWSFGDGTYSNDRNISHQYTSAGTYTVTLNVTGTNGYNESTQTISVIDEPYVTWFNISSNTLYNLTDYQVYLSISNETGRFNWSNEMYLNGSLLQADFDDIRFTDRNYTCLPYWIENISETSMNVWVRVPEISNKTDINTTVYIFSGNTTIGNSSDGTGTFVLFDHFNGSIINDNVWKQEQFVNNNATLNGTFLLIKNASGVTSYQEFDNITMIARFMRQSGNEFAIHFRDTGKEVGQGIFYSVWTRPSYKNKIYRYTSGTGTEIADSSDLTFGTANSWYRYFVNIYGNNFNSTIDSLWTVNITDSNYKIGKIEIGAGTPAEYWIDYIAVAKYERTDFTFDYETPGLISSFRTNARSGIISGGVFPLFIFTNTSSGRIVSWNWSFGDGGWYNTTTFNENVTHAYTSLGEYTARLFVYDENGNENISEKSITIIDEPYYVDGYVSGNSSWLSNMTDYQLNFVIWNVSGSTTGNNVCLPGIARADFGDIRFVGDNNTCLDYWFENVSTNNVSVWVRFPFIQNDPSTNKSFKIFYGNVSLENESNGNNTFIFFDDFSGDLSKWYTQNMTNTITTTNGFLNHYHTGTYGNIQSRGSWVGNCSMTMYMNTTISADQTGWGMVDKNTTLESNAFYMFCRYSLSGYNTYKSTLGTYTQLTSPSYYNATFISGAWYRYTYIRNGSGYTWYKDGNLSQNIQTAPTGPLTYVVYPRVFYDPNAVWTSRTMVDYIYVRTWEPSEPVYSVRAAPISIFTVDKNEGMIYGGNNPTFVFTDFSIGDPYPTSWNWSFGDGTYSNTKNTTHQYTSIGDYIVTLNVSSSYGYNTSSTNISVITEPYYTVATVIGNASWLTDMENYQLKFVLWNTSGSTFGKDVYIPSGTQVDFDDIRFVGTNNTCYDYWMENRSTQNATFWVEIPYIQNDPGVNHTFKIFYGNTSIGNNSNGNNTFIFFDDFSGDLSKWYMYNNTNTITTTGGYLYINHNAAYGNIQSRKGWEGNFSVDARVNFTAAAAQTNSPCAIVDGDREDHTSGFINFFSGSNTAPTHTTYNITTGGYTTAIVNTIYNVSWRPNEFIDFTVTRNASMFFWYKDGNITYDARPVSVIGPKSYVIMPRYWGDATVQTFKTFIDSIRVRRTEVQEPIYFVASTPIASFQSEDNSGVISGTTYPTFVFKDTSFGVPYPTSWNWSFGDGTWYNTTNVNEKNITHTYTSLGDYTVNLNVSSSYGFNDTSQYVSVIEEPSVRLSYVYGNTSWYQTLTDYQVNIIVWNTTGTDRNNNFYAGSSIRNDFGDVRFTNINNTCYDYWIENTSEANTSFWVKIPQITNNSLVNQTVKIWYGNNSITGLSDGNSTFPMFFDNFSTDLGEWWMYNGTNVIDIRDGMLYILNNANDGQIQTKVWWTGNYSLDLKSNVSFSVANYKGFIIIDRDRMDGNGAALFHWYTSPFNNFTTYRRTVGTWNAINVTTPNGGNYVNNQWYTYSMQKNSTQFRYLQNKSIPIGIPFSNTSIGSDNYLVIPRTWGEDITSSITYYIDDVRVRNYTSPEPIVQVEGVPLAQYEVDSTSGIRYGSYNPEFVFRDNTSGHIPATSWNWSFGDGSWYNTTDGCIQNVTHTYMSSGNYSPVLYVSNIYGTNSSEYAPVTIMVIDEPTLYSLNITGSTAWSSDIQNHQIKVVLWNTTGINLDHNIYLGDVIPQIDFDDIRFTGENNTCYDYWIENITSENATIWVEIPIVYESGTMNSTVRLYYGNATIGNESNGFDTFPFFDDFSGTEFNSSQWIYNINTSTSITLSNGNARLYAVGSGVYNQMFPKFGKFTDYELVTKVNYTRATAANCNIRILTGVSNPLTTSVTGFTMGRNGSATYYGLSFLDSAGWGMHIKNIIQGNYSIAKLYFNKSSNYLYARGDTDAWSSRSIGASRNGTFVLQALASSSGTLEGYVDHIFQRNAEPGDVTYLHTLPAPPLLKVVVERDEGVYIDGITYPTFTFKDNTSRADYRNYSFGDGTWYNTSGDSDINVTHTYSNYGTYMVNISCVNGDGYNSTSIPISIVSQTGRQVSYLRGNSSWTSGNLSNFQIKYTLWNTSGTSSGENVYINTTGQLNFNDVRFTDENNTCLDYWVENITSQNMLVWVKVPEISNISGVNTSINIYYGNTTVGNSSDGNGTFIFFDNFDSINASRWVTSGSVTVSSSILTLDRASSVNTALNSINPLYSGKPYITETKYQHPSRYRNRIYLSSSYGGGSPTGYDYGVFDTSIYWNAFTGTNLAINTWYIVKWTDTTSNYVWNITTMDYVSAFERSHGSTIANTGYITFGGTDSDSSDFKLDWMRTRKYTTPEPVYYAYDEPTILPIINFTANTTYGFYPLAVQFNDTSGNSPTSWNWSFGDGNYSSEQNPVYVYPDYGNYTVNLTATNAHGNNTLSRENYIWVESFVPYANFTATVTSGYVPLTLQFNDTSIKNPTSWNWSFGDGEFSETRNASHTYDDVIGTTITKYNVSLNASNEYGMTFENKTDYITAYPLKSSFTSVESVGIQFNDTTTNGTPTAWNWSFDDGTYSEEQNPSHIFADGDYNVVLNASNAYSFDISDPVEINVLMVNYYQDVTINNTGSELTNYQVMFTVNTSNGTSSGSTIYLNSHSQPDLDDLRFGSTSGTFYDYWIDDSTSNPYTVWVEIPSIPSGNSTMRVKYGNEGASAYSNGTNTWYIFDTFESGSVNTTIWDLKAVFSEVTGIFNTEVYSGTYAIGTVQRGGLGSTVYDQNHFFLKLPDSDDAGYRVIQWAKRWYDLGYYGDFAGFGLGGTLEIQNISTDDTYRQYHSRLLRANASALNIQIDENGVGWYNGSKSLAIGSEINYGFQTRHNSYAYGGDSICIRSDVVCVGAYASNDPTDFAWSGEQTTTNIPIASFTVNTTLGVIPFTVEFTDTSLGTPTSWEWDVDNDGVVDYTDQNPVHTYVSHGYYTVNLTASNAYGEDYQLNVDYINVESIGSDFDSNVTEGYSPLTVMFNDTSAGIPSAWNWSFGDGEFSETRNVSHTYDDVIGTTITRYNVSLNASNEYDVMFENKTNYITVYPLESSFTGTENVGIQFNDTTTNGTPTAWNWSFDDGTYSEEQNPFHIFTDGDYEVVLNASNAYSFDLSENLEINVLTLNYYQDVTINNTGSELTNYQVMFTVNTSNGTSSGSTIYLNSNSQPDLDDLRFSSTYGRFYDYWIDDSTSNPYTVWVEIPSIPSGNSTMRVKYGNAGASAYSNGTNTWYIFDTFESGSVNTTIWDIKTLAGTCGIYSTQVYSGTYSIGSEQGPSQGGGISVYDQNHFFLKLPDSDDAGYRVIQWAKGWKSTTWVGHFGGFGLGGTSEIQEINRDGTYRQYHSRLLRANASALNIQIDENGVGWYNGSKSLAIGSEINYGFQTRHNNAADNSIYLRSDVVCVGAYASNDPTDFAWSGEQTTTNIPTASFTTNTTSGIVPFVVAFTDTSLGTPTSWEWDVDNDGVVDYTDQNPVHTYTDTGNYTVNLTVSNAYGEDFQLETNYIYAGTTTPFPSFTSNVTEGEPPLAVSFTDTSTGELISWDWDIDGDGDIDYTSQNVTHTYTLAGVYSVHLRVTNIYTSNWTNVTDYITVGLVPVSDFSGTPTTGVIPSTVTFNATSTGSGSKSYEWDVDGDGDVDYNTRNISHTYSTIGNYTVCLKTSNIYGEDWENKTGYILAGTVPIVDFTSNVTSGIAPFAVSFTNITTGYPTPTYAWDVDFNNVTDYTTASSTHLYTTVNYYTVRLTSSNIFGTVNETKLNYITAGSIPVAYFTATGTGGATPYTTSFNATVTGFPNATYYWDIDNDGDTDYTGRNITHTYTSYGQYSVNLTTSNILGTNKSIRNNYISVGMEPKVSFFGNPLSGVNIVTTQFNDSTSGSPTVWNWSFGDGTWFNTSTPSLKNPSHSYVYGTDGLYTVSLTCTNSYGINTTYRTAYVHVTGVPSSDVIFTYNVTNLSVSSATFNGLIADNYTDDVWFEYGMNPAGMTMATKHIRDITGESNFSKNITLSSLYPGEVYYYRAVSESNGYGDIKLFTVPTPSPSVAGETVPQVFTEERDRFVQVERSDFEFEVLAPLVSDVYTSLWGFWIYGFIWAGIFAAFWLRQEDVTIPTLIYIIFSYSISRYLPAAWMPFIYGSIVISLVGMIYVLFRGKRNG